MKSMKMSGGLFPLLLILPSVLMVALLVAYPIVTIVINSLQENNLLSPPEFVAFDNYVYLLTQDPFFWKVVGNTILWTLVTVSGEVVLGLVIALALNQAVFARGFFRGVITLPWIIPPVTAALVWGTLYAGHDGPFNQWLQGIGVEPVNWLSDSSTSLLSVAVVAIWKYTPLMAVGILAALQSIPQELYEAAAVDGSSRWQTLWRITIPSITPIVTVLSILSVMWRFGQFDLIHIMTHGGPAFSSQIIAPYAFDKAIGRLEIGLGSALSLLGVILVLLAVGPLIRKIVRTDLS